MTYLLTSKTSWFFEMGLQEEENALTAHVITFKTSWFFDRGRHKEESLPVLWQPQ
jgi:hypothetical protein